MKRAGSDGTGCDNFRTRKGEYEIRSAAAYLAALPLERVRLATHGLALLLAIVVGTNHAQAGFLGVYDPYLSAGNETVFGIVALTLPEPNGAFAHVFNTGTALHSNGGVAVNSLGANLSVVGSPQTLQLNANTLGLSADGGAIYPLFIGPSYYPPGYSLVAWTEERFEITGNIAPGDNVVFSAQGGTNLYSAATATSWTPPIFHDDLSTPGPFDLKFFAQGPYVYLAGPDPYGVTFDLDSGMGFTIEITHVNPTQATSVQFLDPVVSYAMPSGFVATPEPASLTLLGLGSLGLLGYGWRRRKQTKA